MLRRFITALALTGVVGMLPTGAMQLSNPQAEYSDNQVPLAFPRVGMAQEKKFKQEQSDLEKQLGF